MAGGMRRRIDRGTLAERRAATESAAAPRPPDPPSVRHCWVVGADGALPGLLLGWEQRASGWWGRAVHPVRAADDGWVVVEEWLPADRLRPATAGPAVGPAAGPDGAGPSTLPGAPHRS